MKYYHQLVLIKWMQNRSMLRNLFNSIRSKDKVNECDYLSRSLVEPFFWPKELRKGDLMSLRMWGNFWKEKAEEMDSLIIYMIWHKPSLHLICTCTEQKKKSTAEALPTELWCETVSSSQTGPWLGNVQSRHTHSTAKLWKPNWL